MKFFVKSKKSLDYEIQLNYNYGAIIKVVKFIIIII